MGVACRVWGSGYSGGVDGLRISEGQEDNEGVVSSWNAARSPRSEASSGEACAEVDALENHDDQGVSPVETPGRGEQGKRRHRMEGKTGFSRPRLDAPCGNLAKERNARLPGWAR